MGATERTGGPPAWKTLCVGGAAGLCSCVLLQPMDLLKTRMQQERVGTSGAPTQRLVHAVRSVLQHNGWRGLWRGTVPTVARNVPGVAAYFYTITEMRWLVARWHVPVLSHAAPQAARGTHGSTLARLSTPGNLLTGAAARVAIGFVLNPITVVKARFESSHYARDSYPTIASAFRGIYHDGGPRAFFRGFSATALRDAPYAGVYLAIYEQQKHFFSSFAQRLHAGEAHGRIDYTGEWWVVSASSTYTPRASLTAGLVAGTLATVLTHPFDIVKTRMQTTPATLLAAQGAAGSALRPGVFATARHVLAADGVQAFSDGLLLRCSRKAASSMIGWSIFELGNRWVSQGAVAAKTRTG
ncbi:hypothetical protein MSPP1_003826 [Malassezia sp. CBS 17886]|nr:hypothetical protein MSPP1_003826 [Malassezia sp. CBS 17886]